MAASWLAARLQCKSRRDHLLWKVHWDKYR